jgi:hypothetical protein
MKSCGAGFTCRDSQPTREGSAVWKLGRKMAENTIGCQHTSTQTINSSIQFIKPIFQGSWSRCMSNPTMVYHSHLVAPSQNFDKYASSSPNTLCLPALK